MDGLAQVERGLHGLAISSPLDIRELLTYALGDKGKRIRPAITLLAANLRPHQKQPVVLMATAIELLHLATLLHDDAVDDSTLRRGRATVSKNWGGNIAVLLGDYVFGVSAVYVCDTRNVQAIRAFAQTIRDLSHGQLLEYLRSFKWDQTRSDYNDRISCKTASLFRTAAQVGGILSDAPEEWVRTLASYGHNLGMAFQVVDDILDYEAKTEQVGKPVGNDLLHGIVTLPVIMLMEHNAESNSIKQLFEERAPQHLVAEVVEIVRSSGILERCYDIAEEYCNKAAENLQILPDSPSRRSLEALTRFVVERRR
jgi:geranylgeranyl pyrophosphate synthase